MTKKYATVRKATQRLAPLKGQKCAVCGKHKYKNNLQRHHPDYTNPRKRVILCQGCHAKKHVEEQTWGKQQLRTK